MNFFTNSKFFFRKTRDDLLENAFQAIKSIQKEGTLLFFKKAFSYFEDVYAFKDLC